MLLQVVIFSLLVSWLAGGKLKQLTNIKLAGAAFMLGAFIMQAFSSRLSVLNEDFGYFLLVGSYLVLLIALSRNEPTLAIGLMALGVFLNFIVISLNGGMPVPTSVLPVGFNDSVHIKLTETTLLPWLGDVITWPLPRPLGGLISPGDTLLSAGIFTLIYTGMKYTGKRRLLEK